MNIEMKIVPKLNLLGLTIATAESCTAGLIAATLVNCNKASNTLKEGFIVYTEDAKMQRLGVKKETLEEYTAVSKETAYEMAEGLVKASGVDIGLAATGYASYYPEDKFGRPSGIIFISMSINGETKVKELALKGDKQENRLETVQIILEWLNEELDRMLFESTVLANNKNTSDKWGCGCAIINKYGEVVLGCRAKPGDLPQWCLIGGEIENGENPFEAMKREIREESSLIPFNVEFVDLYQKDGVNNFLFICKDYEGKIKAQEEELSEIKWFKFEDVKKLDLFPFTAASLEVFKKNNII